MIDINNNTAVVFPGQGSQVIGMGADLYEKSSIAKDIFDEVDETGTTLHENASIKSRTIFEKFNIDCFSDDTGLLVDELDGAPGVYSARYAGEDANANNNIIKLSS